MKKAKDNSKKLLFMFSVVVFVIIATVFIIQKYKAKYFLLIIKEVNKEKIETFGEKTNFLYVLKRVDGNNKIYDFFYNDKKYFTVSGDLQSVFVNKNNPTKDFYIHLNDKLIIYPQKTTIKVGYNDNFKIISKDGKHIGGVWIDKDKNIYKTALHFEPNFSCDGASLKILNEKYKMNITNEECNKHKSKCCGSNAICVKQKYNKENKVLEQERAELTKTEACGALGCLKDTFDKLDKNYLFVGNRIEDVKYSENKELEKKIKDKLKDFITIKDEVLIGFVETKDLIIVNSMYDSKAFGKIFILDKNLDLKTVLNLGDEIYNFIVKNNKLFVSTYNKISIYDLNNFKRIEDFGEMVFFSFV